MTLVSRKERVPIELIPVLFYTIFSLLVPYDLRSRILFYSFTIVYCFLRVIVPFYRKIVLGIFHGRDSLFEMCLIITRLTIIKDTIHHATLFFSQRDEGTKGDMD